MIDLSTFIDLLIEKKIDTYDRVYFVGETYPLLFFSFLLQKISSFNKRLHRVQFESYEPSNISQLLEVSFLGESLFYWFGDVESYFTTKTKNFLANLVDYQGPHVVWLFIKEDQLPENTTKENMLVVSLAVDKKKLAKIIEFLFGNSAKKYEKIESLFSKNASQYSLDQVCLLAHYCRVLNINQITQFGAEWKDQLLPEQHSLFTLSSLFFAKKKKLFFQMWYSIAPTYALPFWISYWSEQVFRAAYFIAAHKNNMSFEAKKIAYKLPFSFINHDWKNISITELQKAHDWLYAIDYHFKQGGSDKSIDIFFMNFFSHYKISSVGTL